MSITMYVGWVGNTMFRFTTDIGNRLWITSKTLRQAAYKGSGTDVEMLQGVLPLHKIYLNDTALGPDGGWLVSMEGARTVLFKALKRGYISVETYGAVMRWFRAEEGQNSTERYSDQTDDQTAGLDASTERRFDREMLRLCTDPLFAPYMAEKIQEMFGAAAKPEQLVRHSVPYLITDVIKDNEKLLGIWSKHSGIHIGTMAKLLQQEGVTDRGQNSMFELLRQRGYLHGRGIRKNLPVQKYLDQGLFKILENTYIDPDLGEMPSFTTLVTQKGVEYFLTKFRDGVLV